MIFILYFVKRGVRMEEKKERTVTRVEDGEKVKKTVKKAEEVAEAAETEVKNVKKVETLSKAEEKSKAITLRIVSAILWVFAIGFEVLAILCLFKALRLPGLSQMWWMIIFIVLDLACCIVAALLWKKASHLDPFSKKNKFTFFVLTQLGVIMAAICFIPLIILVLTSKDKLDKKTKIVVTAVAIVALLIAGELRDHFYDTLKDGKADFRRTAGDMSQSALLAVPVGIHAAGERIRGTFFSGSSTASASFPCSSPGPSGR